MTTTIHPVILSGGSGTRLWPLSRSNLPKQFMAPLSGPTLLQKTVERVMGDAFAPPILVCHEDHRFIASEQLRAMNVSPARTILEPTGRNTAPAAAIAALLIEQEDPSGLMLILPADHLIDDNQGFLAAVQSGSKAADQGALVTFGITPNRAEIGYGYIHQGEPVEGAAGCFHVSRFIEKPDLPTAESFINAGDYLWNSGIFLFPISHFLKELTRLEPDMLDLCKAAIDGMESDLWFHRLPAKSFSDVKSISIDHAIMERTENAAVVPVEFAWSDIGSWDGLWQAADKNEHGNLHFGEAVTLDVENSCLYGDGILVAALGVENLIIAARDDAVLVAPRERAQEVRKLVERLESNGNTKYLSHPQVFRPWGFYQTVISGNEFLVKRIQVTPGGKLSVQMHHHRAEHWVVVAGSARVTRGEETLDLKENESTYIPIGMKHSIENLNDEPLIFIEVQTGAQLSEDDIVRFEDIYGRAEKNNNDSNS